MIFRPFGGTLKKVSEIGLGLSQLSQTKNTKSYGYKSEKQVLSIIRHAIKKKINFFDTADTYGETEKILGNLSKREKNKIIISTKAGWKPDGNRCFKAKYLEQQLDRSLKNIKTEKIDLFMLNKPKFDEVNKEDLIHFLEKLKKKGKIELSGIIIGDANNFSKIISRKEIDIFSILFNLNSTNHLSLINKIKKKKGIIIRSPLNSGLLSGKVNYNTKFHPEDERSNYFNNEILKKKMVKIKELQKKLNINDKSLLKFSMDFALSNKFISTVLIGCSSMEQLKKILKYHSKTRYLSDKIYNKAIKCSKILTKKYRMSDQLL